MTSPLVPEREIDEYITVIHQLHAQKKTTREIARILQLSQSTVARRLRGVQNRRTAHENAQRLSPTQEADLSAWILALERGGHSPTKVLIRGFAHCILEADGDKTPLGLHWVDSFISRHPELRTKIGRPVSASRIEGTTNKEVVADYFAHLRQLQDEYKVLPRNMANMDETGFQEGESGKGVVVGCSATSRARIVQSDATNWVTILECITTERRITPGIIYQGKSLQAQWFPHDLPDFEYGATATGWSDTRTLMAWFTKCYEVETRPPPGEWRILILDGHSTHMNRNFHHMCWRAKVLLCFLPAHTSDKTQPLDLAVFGPLSTFFHQEIRDISQVATTAPMYKQRFISAYKVAGEKAFSGSNIRSAFKAAGILPYNPKVILENTEIFPPKPPPTPPKSDYELLWSTPKKGLDIRLAAERLESTLGPLPRDFRTLLNKSAKSLDLAHVLPAKKDREIQLLESQIEKLRPAKRETVKPGPNQVFFNNREIRTAEERRLLRLPDQPLPTQLQIDDFTVENTIKPAKKPKTNKKASKGA